MKTSSKKYLNKVITFINKAKVETIFLVLFVPYSLAMLTLTPPFQVPDEASHLYKSYYTSEINFVAHKDAEGSGGQLPASLQDVALMLQGNLPENIQNKVSLKTFKKSFSIPLNKSKTTFLRFSNTAVYSIVPYLPQAVGVGIGRMLNFPPVMLLYLARLANIIAAGALLYFAIKKAPFYKWLILAIALLPMVMAEVSSASADAFTVAISILSISYILNLAFNKEINKLKIKHYSIAALLLILLAFSKQTYMFIGLLILLIPREKFGSKARKVLITGTILLMSILPSLIWTLFSGQFYKGQSNIAIAKDYYLHNPIHLGFQIFRDYFLGGASYVEEIIGRLGYLEVRLPYLILHLPYIILLFMLLYKEKAKVLFSNIKTKLLLSTVVVTTAVAITAAVLIYWSSQYIPPYIGGIEIAQGRYFIPILIPALFILTSDKIDLDIKIKNPRIYLVAFLIYSMLITLFSIFMRFYIGWLR